jgi:hypothetical protein
MSSKDFDLIVTKDKDGEALEAPATITYTATLTETTFTVSDVFETERMNHSDWNTVEDGISWFLKETEGTR